MSLHTKAEYTRRRWMGWAAKELPTFRPLNEAAVADMLEKIRSAERAFRPARNYEHTSVSFELFADVIERVVRQCTERLLVTSGDHLAPAMFEIEVGDLRRLLEKVAAEDSTIALNTLDPYGGLVVDAPLPHELEGEMLVSAIGAFAPMIDFVKQRIPGGAEFRGNR